MGPRQGGLPAGGAAPAADPAGVLVVGDGATNTRRYVAAAGMAGWPVLSEPNGGARYGDHAMSAYHFLLGTPEFADRHRPDVVVTLGRPGLSRPLLNWLRHADEHIVVAADMTRWPDPTRSATQVAQVVEIPVAAGDDAWLHSWRRAETAARTAIDEVLDGTTGLNEPRLARDLVEALPNGSLLFSGSSMPIRDLDQAMRPRRGLRILANRGAAGIDGVVSSAMGAALAHNGPSYALMGDLTFLHDQNGLLLGSREPRPDLCLVVVNNDGGGIFSLLPQAALRGPSSGSSAPRTGLTWATWPPPPARRTPSWTSRASWSRRCAATGCAWSRCGPTGSPTRCCTP